MITLTKLLAEQVQDTHGTMIATTKDVTSEVAHWQPPGSAHSIAATWAHGVFTDDSVINQILRSGTPLYAGSWNDQTGVNKLQPEAGENWEHEYSAWTEELKLDLNQFREYMKAVFSQTEQYIEKLTDEDLIKEVDATAIGMGLRPVHSIISNAIVAHGDNISGEISALKGLQGLKGYPW